MKRLLLFFMIAVFAIAAKAQIRGCVTDADNGDSIAFVTVAYKGKHIATVGDPMGYYSISKLDGQSLTFSAVGYKPKQVTITSHTPSVLNVKLSPDNKYLDEVTIKSKRSRYSRKANPAVEFMRRVIAARQQTKLENKDYYQYRNYEKLTISKNNISEKKVTDGSYAKKEWLKKQLEVNPLTGQATLPVIVNEKISRKLYRKDPEKERIIIDAETSYGVNELIETGNILTAMAKDVFTEVDIYDDQVRLLQYPFTSPIGKGAIGFYRFYLVDTVKVDRDSCIQVSFVPNNQQDFGFRGDLWILKDSSLHVKKVHLSIPKRSDVNFVTSMSIDQEYLKMETGDWVLSNNDMLIEMSITGQAGNFLISRTSRRNDYSFEPIDDKLFRGKALEKKDPYAEMRSKEYWADNREVPLSNGEAGMDEFIKAIKNTKGFGWLMLGVKGILENFIETSKGDNPSKVDIGPVTSMVSTNDIDGFRLRMSAQTTANLNPHFFLKGYGAYGFRSKNLYYGVTATYSFNKKAYTPDEFPKRNIIVSSSHDVCSPSDKFVYVDKDNIFTAIRWTNVMKQAIYDRQEIAFEREEDWGFSIRGGFKFERNKAVGDWKFQHIGETLADGDLGKFRTSEMYLQLEYSPGQSYINSKMRRRTTNRDSPIYRLKHTLGVSGLLGGQYNYQCTEAAIIKRVWLHSFGKLEINVKGGVQWSQVPFPLLIAPAASMSYIWQPETFELINNMEFLNDKYASAILEWDLNGKLFNRIPLLKHLQWRELVGFNILYGGLSERNNPYLEENKDNSKLMYFPEGCNIMDPRKPYMEFRVGIHNILKLLQVEYVRRINYLELPTANKHSVRFGFRMTF